SPIYTYRSPDDTAIQITQRLQNGLLGANNLLGRRLRASRRRPWRNPRRLRHAGLQRSYLGAHVIISTIYLIAGELRNADTPAIKGQVYRVPRLGAIAFEAQRGHDTGRIGTDNSHDTSGRTD